MLAPIIAISGMFTFAWTASVLVTIVDMGLKLPPTRVDLKAITEKYHAAAAKQEQAAAGKKPSTPAGKA
ncbi:hypothetical protein ACCAA_330032 [Candidatus Accumulibacter aalborgensis]|uniref:Uncharacterized protein n=1 Tax=Candidatus Accumulibacter aalborgensis TaxID=1860102 RepID=A0A1A8XMR1_9PROT|nr:hypothetical protein ACCAA_330032 [Candidatus Accumulibacter aalborgensis]